MSMHWYTYIGPYLKISQKIRLHLRSQMNAKQGDHYELAEKFFWNDFISQEGMAKGLYIPNDSTTQGAYWSDNDGSSECFFDLSEGHIIRDAISAFITKNTELILTLRTIDPTGIEVGYGLISYFM